MAEYGVKAISAYCGVNPHTLRIWERRYGAVTPLRTANGRRVYSQLDAERLCLIAALTARGHGISKIAKLQLSDLEELMNAVAKVRSAKIPTPFVTQGIEKSDNNGLGNMFLDRMSTALEGFQLKNLSSQLALARLHCNVSEFIYQIVLPLIGQIGMMVAEERLSIAHEHALSAILKTHIYQAIYQLNALHSGFHDAGDEKAQGIRKLVIATQEGDFHEFGILLASLLAESRGIQTFFFGCNMPARSLAGAANAVGTATVLIGRAIRSPLLDSQGNVITQKEYLKELDHNLIASSEIWVGGVTEQNALKFRSRHTITHLATLEDLDKKLNDLVKTAASVNAMSKSLKPMES